MKTLHVLDISMPYLKGYTIRSQSIVEAQKKAGMSPIVITSPRHTNFTSDKETINGINYYRTRNVFSSIKVPYLSQILEVKSFAHAIEAVIEKENIEIIHAHSPVLCGMAAIRAAQKHSLPFLYEIRAFWEDAAVSSGKCQHNDMRYRFTRVLETRLCKKAQKIVAISHGIKQELVNRGIEKKKINIVPNGIALSAFEEKSKRLHLLKKYNLENCVVIGFIGSFFRFEGLDLLVELITKLKTQNIKLLLVGDGEEFKNLQAYANQLGVDDMVIFTGRIPHEEISSHYALIDIFVYPRLSERITELTTPLKPLETMAMKKNLIISNVGGLKELVPENCGEIFIAGDVADLKGKVEKIINDKEYSKHQVHNAYEFVKTRDWNANIKRYKAIYSDF